MTGQLEFWGPVLAVWLGLAGIAALLLWRLRRWWQRLLVVLIGLAAGYAWFAAWVGAYVIGLLIRKLLGG